MADPICDRFPDDRVYLCTPSDVRDCGTVLEPCTDENRCQIGCSQSCPDFARLGLDGMFGYVGIAQGGTRFLAPDPNRPSRLATGHYDVLRSGSAVWIPSQWNGRRAACWHPNLGLECYGMTSCDCANNGEDGRPVLDAFFYPDTGWAWTNATAVQCRLTSQIRDMLCTFGAQPFGNMAIGHLLTPTAWFGMATSGRSECARNMMVLIAEQPESPCRDQQDPPISYYADLSHRTLFLRVHVTRLTCRMRTPRHLHAEPYVRETQAIMNNALAFIQADTEGGASLFHMDQMDHHNPNNINAFLGLYRRDFNSAGDRPLDTLRTQYRFATLPNCRLRHTGVPINVDLFIRGASLAMHMILHTIDEPLGGEPQVYPAIRLQLAVELGAYATLANAADRYATRQWLPEGHADLVVDLKPTNTGSVQPTVAGGQERVVMVRNGVELPGIPPRFTWEGEISPLSTRGQWRDVWRTRQPCANLSFDRGKLCELVTALRGLKVFGFTTDPFRTDPNGRYDGFVTLEWRDLFGACDCG